MLKCNLNVSHLQFFSSLNNVVFITIRHALHAGCSCEIYQTSDPSQLLQNMLTNIK